MSIVYLIDVTIYTHRMNMPKQLVTIVVMLTLLIAQTSGAFFLTPGMPCSMQITSDHSLHHDAQAEAMTDRDMVKSDMSESLVSEHGMPIKMDCCDSDDVNVCCDEQCGCVAFAGTGVFIHAQLSGGQLPGASDAFKDVSPMLHSAFSALLIRPPILS